MDLIDREELLKTLRNFDYVKWYYRDLTDAIINMPTVDAEPVRHGKWIKCIHPTYKAHTVKCSCCGGYALHDSDGYWVESNYCPHCNANMDGD